MLGDEEGAKTEDRRGVGGHARRRGSSSNRRWEVGMLGEGEAAQTEDGRGACYEKGNQLKQQMGGGRHARRRKSS